MERKNIGRIARLALRQFFGAEKGQALVDLIEGGYLPALHALSRGDFHGFLTWLPKEALDGLFALVIKQAVGLGQVALTEENK